MGGALGKQVPWKGTEGLGCERAWVLQGQPLDIDHGTPLKTKTPFGI